MLSLIVNLVVHKTMYYITKNTIAKGLFQKKFILQAALIHLHLLKEKLYSVSVLKH